MSKLDDLKKEILAVDSMMADLLVKRMELVRKAGSEPLFSPVRKTYIINQLSANMDEKDYRYFLRFQNNLFELTDMCQSCQANTYDGFLRDNSDKSKFRDGAFAVSHQASMDKKENGDLVINATIGTIHDEDDSMVAYKSVYDCFNRVTDGRKASYANGICGNEDFRRAIFDWINRDHNIELPHSVVAAVGGTGALALCFNTLLNSSEIILTPRVAWSSYSTMVAHQGLQAENYELIDADGNINLTDMMAKGINIMKKQHKLVVLINDPCQNPSGITLGDENWQKIVNYLNKMSQFGKVILINDIAYLDYSNTDGRSYFKYFNQLDPNVLTVLAFSCSKTLTAYGMRLGAAIILNRNQEEVDRIENSFAKAARSLWSNVNNGLMDSFVDVVTNHLEEFDRERAYYVQLIRERAQIFLEEAAKENLKLYPYADGFFITMIIEDAVLLDRYYSYLTSHHVYTIKVNGGIRIAVCSLNKKDCQRLPKILRESLEAVKNA